MEGDDFVSARGIIVCFSCGKGEGKGKEWRNYGKRTAASVCTSRPVTRRWREKAWERSQRLRDARLTSMRPRR